MQRREAHQARIDGREPHRLMESDYLLGVLDEHGNLWIAKFPGRNDDRDIGAWEQVTSELARLAGVTISDSMSEVFGQPQHTFLTQRFDRKTTDHVRQRQHFASAMTMLGYRDGDDHQTGASYLEIAEWIIQNQREIDDDLAQLWRRIVFSICVSNTDDHLRNHGFLLTDRGWRLSPAYDLNPDPQGTGLSLNISEIDNALSLELAREVAPYFRIGAGDANEIVGQVIDSVCQWRQVATRRGINRSEQNRMQSAFRVSAR